MALVLDLLGRLAQLRLQRLRRAQNANGAMYDAVSQDDVDLLEIDYRAALLDLAREPGGEARMEELGLK